MKLGITINYKQWYTLNDPVKCKSCNSLGHVARINLVPEPAGMSIFCPEHAEEQGFSEDDMLLLINLTEKHENM